MESNTPNSKEQSLIRMIQRMLNLIIVLVSFIIFLPLAIYNADTISGWFKSTNVKAITPAFPEPKSIKASNVEATAAYWQPKAMDAVADPALKEQVYYGRELIAHTAKYLGPNGSVLQITNGQNCQNCHLQAGTMTFGNNYGSVASTYPKFRARSGSTENIYKRVNDCFERSLNGKALDTTSKEMQAIVAYINHIGSNVSKGEKAVGSGLKDMVFLDRAANPEMGKTVYETKCQSCHQANGEGVLNPDKIEYSFPPLWGKHSFNDGAGLYRLTSFAKYIKYNMPLGVTHENPQLNDEEAWDVSAYILSQPRPHLAVPKDWPDISKKPIDHPFGPYSDNFTEKQHKYGPFKPIAAKAKK
jgi:thiosulfate dehydrogenase